MRITVLGTAIDRIGQLLADHREAVVGLETERYGAVIVTCAAKPAGARVHDVLVDELGPELVRTGVHSLPMILGTDLRRRGLMLATAESCTGGMIGSWLTDVSGSSAWYWGGVVSYANAAKTQLLGVSTRSLDQYGAVSEETARAMAAGIQALSDADIGLAVTGIAGPDGGSPEKPVGTVWIAIAASDDHTVGCRFSGDREMVRRKTASVALLAVERMLYDERPTTLSGGWVDRVRSW